MNSSIKLCEYYKYLKTCTYEGFCIEQLSTDHTKCCSDLYLAMALKEQLEQAEQKLEKIKEEWHKFTMKLPLVEIVTMWKQFSKSEKILKGDTK